MRLGIWQSRSTLCAALLTLTVACGDDSKDDADTDGNETAATETGTEVGDGDGDPGDGDGDPGDGDGDPGDGDGDPGDGDGDPGDGDGDPGDGDGDPGDGDGDPGDGDGDGVDPNSPCFDLGSADECDADAECQSVTGSPLKANGPDSPCLEPAEFLGCIPMQGCDDAETWFCQGNNEWLVPDSCGPQNAQECEAPADPLDACP